MGFLSDMLTMSEIERAIEHIADNVRFLRTHSNVDNSLEAHELALTALKEKLDREKNAPLTWNERINQMTIDEKVEWLNGSDYCRVTEIPIFECDAYKDCKECMRAFLNSPYTEGATK